jgi:hypothetical protein
MPKPSKKVRTLFDEVEALALQLEDFTLEEERLRDTLEKLWRQKTLVMANLAAKAHEATATESDECRARNKVK